MTYIAKPKLHHPSLVKNKAGYTRRDYEGAVRDGIPKVMVRAKHPLLLTGKFNHFPSILERQGKRLLAEHVLSGLQGRLRLRVMELVGRADVHDV